MGRWRKREHACMRMGEQEEKGDQEYVDNERESGKGNSKVALEREKKGKGIICKEMVDNMADRSKLEKKKVRVELMEKGELKGHWKGMTYGKGAWRWEIKDIKGDDGKENGKKKKVEREGRRDENKRTRRTEWRRNETFIPVNKKDNDTVQYTEVNKVRV